MLRWAQYWICRENIRRCETRKQKNVARLFGVTQIVAFSNGICTGYESTAQRLLIVAGGSLVNLVAGTGFEPVTFGL